MNKDLQAEIDNWRADYLHLGYELGEIINEQQDKIISLSQENKRLKREIWNIKKTKRRKSHGILTRRTRDGYSL